MTGRPRTVAVENGVLVVILTLVGMFAGAASFTHVHDWTMANSPAGTPGWFGWANAVISELIPIAALLTVRRRKRVGESIGYPMFLLVAAVALSLAAQLAVAKPGLSGWLLSAVPALAFLGLSKLVLTTKPVPVIVPDRPTEDASVPDGQSAPDGSDLLVAAKHAATAYRAEHGRDITRDALRDHLRVSNATAGDLLRQLRPPRPRTPSTPLPVPTLTRPNRANGEVTP